MAKEPKKLIANNKKVYHDYFLLEKYEAGISLAGTCLLYTSERETMHISLHLRPVRLIQSVQSLSGM